jgi:hypothetical protein
MEYEFRKRHSNPHKMIFNNIPFGKAKKYDKNVIFSHIPVLYFNSLFFSFSLIV